MAKKLKNVHLGGFQLAMFTPDSEWKPPSELPDLRQARAIGVDVESYDPNLNKMGPGFIRGDARVVGISLAVLDGPKLYLPFGHEMGGNMDKDQVIRYVADQLKYEDQAKVGANFMYELEALASLGIQVKGPIEDIQIAEPLLDEDRPGGNSLEALSMSYLGRGKNEKKLRDAANALSLDPKKDMWRLHSKYVGEYGEDDAYNPLEIIELQKQQIEKEKLTDVWKLESELLPVLWKMRARGIRVDLEAADRLSREMKAEEDQLISRVWSETGYKVDPWSSKSLAIFLNQMGLGFYIQFTAPSKQHPQGQPSFTNEWFKKMGNEHPVFGWLRDIRVMSKIRRDFVDGLILQNHIRGRLHPQWHQLRTTTEGSDDEGDENGARTGRIASSKPCLTNIPVRDPVWGKRMRSIFIADEGGKYCKNDFSSQEPRILLHFAYIKNYKGAAEARQRYLDDPYTDYHQMTADLIHLRTGKLIERRLAKDINLGSAYGMGFYKLANKLGLGLEEAKQLLKVYHEGVPYVKKLEERCMEIVQAQGFIRTILGRKRRFKKWEPKDWERKKGAIPTEDYDLAIEQWGHNIERSDAHKALNSVCQGSAADQTKTAIILLDREGLTPQIQVYDELGQTIWNPEDAYRIKEIMEHAIEFEIPHIADPEVGRSWGETKDPEE
jgi:DNA polymerase I-like protein with 3'-5' exonuclease and polymerase domains